jgi:ATP/maltotriose-dependent transcriptional regulator MalT
LRQTGAVERAEAVARAGAQHGRDGASEYTTAVNERVLGRIARGRGDFAAAEALLRGALAAFSRLEARLQAARTLLDLAELGRAQGQSDAATACLGDARAAFTALGIPRFAERAHVLAGALGPTTAMPPAGPR